MLDLGRLCVSQSQHTARIRYAILASPRGNREYFCLHAIETTRAGLLWYEKNWLALAAGLPAQVSILVVISILAMDVQGGYNLL